MSSIEGNREHLTHSVISNDAERAEKSILAINEVYIECLFQRL